MYNFFSLDVNLRLEKVTVFSFDDTRSLLDADIVLIDPASVSNVWAGVVQKRDNGTRYVYSNRGSDRIRETFLKRRREIEYLLENGKIIISFLSPVTAVDLEYRDNNQYHLFTNYHWLPDKLLPFIDMIATGEGQTITLNSPTHYLAQYFRAYRDKLLYKAYLNFTVSEDKKNKLNNNFLINKTSNPVGSSLDYLNGMICFIPYPTEDNQEKLFGILMQCAKSYLKKDIRTEEPDWVSKYSLTGEKEYLEKLEAIQTEINQLIKSKKNIEEEKQIISRFKGLLYEQGAPLEDIVIQSLRFFGFNANRYKEMDMEHDIIMESEEGRAIAEVEGRDNESIHIEKLDQLSRVVDEDFHVHGSYSEGILIGNAYRLLPPEKRKEHFTEKVKLSAQRKKFGLLSTEELFRAVSLVLEKPEDEDLKKSIRQAILRPDGNEIKFGS